MDVVLLSGSLRFIAVTSITLAPSNNIFPMKGGHDLFAAYFSGYESFKKKYTVFNSRTHYKRAGKVNIEFKVFTLGTNSWRRIGAVLPFEVDHFEAESIFHLESLCLNGALHWAVSFDEIVLVFDLKDENFHQIPGPSGASNKLF